MENANLSFIHPEKQVDIYGGLAFLALAVRAPFPGLKQTVTMKKLSPFCLSGLAKLLLQMFRQNESPKEVIWEIL